MRRLAQQGVVALIAVLLAMSLVTPAVVADHAGAPTDDEQIDYKAGAAPNVYAHADTITIAEHDRAAMSSEWNYYDDNGDIQSLAADGAELNDSADTPFGVNLTKVKDIRYRTFPRLAAEDGNGASWTNAANWSTSSDTNSGMTVSSGTVDGANVSTVTFDVTAVSGEMAQATYSRVDITSDATKRVGQVGLNVQMNDGHHGEVRIEDGDGDYVALTINASADAANDSAVITDRNGTAFVAQEKLANLAVQGSGDSTFDGIQHVRVRGEDADATIEVFWLDIEKKTTADLLEVERDTDGDGSIELTYIEDKYQSGYAWTTGVDTLPDWTSDAQVFDLQLKDVSFPIENVADAHNNISLDDHPTYDGGELDGYWRHEVPGQIDLSYANLTLLAEQTAPGDRYETVEHATDVGGTNFTNVSYTAATSSFDDEGKTVILVSNLNAGEEWAVHVEQALTVEEEEALTSMPAAAMGPGVDSGGGGGLTGLPVIGTIVAALGGVVAWVKELGPFGG